MLRPTRSRFSALYDTLRGREGARLSGPLLREFYETKYICLNPTLDVEYAAGKAAALLTACQQAGIPQVRTLLEVGCGAGAVLANMRSGLKARRYVGVDYGLPQARVAATVSGAPAVVADGARLPFLPRSFELAYFVDVLEHVLDPEALLREIGRVATYVGFLVPLEAGLLSSPIYAYRRLRGRATNLEQYGHIWRWARPGVMRLFRRADFRVIVASPFYSPASRYTTSWGHLFAECQRLAHRLHPSVAEALFGGVSLVGVATSMNSRGRPDLSDGARSI